MPKVDYIVVGLGIAGLSVCEQLLKNNKRFVLFDSGLNNATSVAGGVINPVVLKRITPAWNANTFFDHSVSFYRNLEKRLGSKICEPASILRILHNVAEQNDWTAASDRAVLSEFIDPDPGPNQYEFINAPYGFGIVRKALRINTSEMLAQYSELLKRSHAFRNEKFEYGRFTASAAAVNYMDIDAGNIIFTDGACGRDNPYFSSDLLIPNKGEYIIIRSSHLKLDRVVKGAVFIIPQGNDLYKIGATFNRAPFDHGTSEQGKEKLIKETEKMINCSFEVVDHTWGIRPTTRDRRPLLGAIDNDRIHFLTGLGTRGLLMAPMLAAWLYDHLEDKTQLPPEVNIKRLL